MLAILFGSQMCQGLNLKLSSILQSANNMKKGQSILKPNMLLCHQKNINIKFYPAWTEKQIQPTCWTALTHVA